jgi:hypothetical protein
VTHVFSGRPGATACNVWTTEGFPANNDGDLGLRKVAILTAKRATASIPIAMLLGIYPEQAGLVVSLARPGGNITGTSVGPVTGGKYLELLKGAVPRLTRVALLWDPTFPGFANTAAQEELGVEVRKLGLTLASIGNPTVGGYRAGHREDRNGKARRFVGSTDRSPRGEHAAGYRLRRQAPAADDILGSIAASRPPRPKIRLPG